MALKTLGELITFVQDKLDLRDEDFITTTEMTSYFEEAIRYCESEIHKLNIEDQYFVAQSTMRLVNGQADYALPANMYANKILRVMYSNGSELYDIRRLTKQYRFQDAELSRRYSVGNPATYQYMLVNLDPRLGTKVRLFPTPLETTTTVTSTGTTVSGSPIITGLGSTTGMAAEYFVSGTGIVDGTRIQSVDSATQITMAENAVASGTVSITATEPRVLVWYIRNASIPSATTDYIDFPEFWHYIAQFVIVNCLKKELGNPRVQIEVETLLKMEKQMLETLSNMVPDQDDTVEQDLSSYSEGNY
jgi:hypothetical protein